MSNMSLISFENPDKTDRSKLLRYVIPRGLSRETTEENVSM